MAKKILQKDYSKTRSRMITKEHDYFGSTDKAGTPPDFTHNFSFPSQNNFTRQGLQ